MCHSMIMSTACDMERLIILGTVLHSSYFLILGSKKVQRVPTSPLVVQSRYKLVRTSVINLFTKLTHTVLTWMVCVVVVVYFFT